MNDVPIEVGSRLRRGVLPTRAFSRFCERIGKKNMTRHGLTHLHEKSERTHVRQNEQDFRLVCRRDKLLGLWVAGQIGLVGQAAEAYARDVIAAHLERPGDDAVVITVMRDFRKRRLPVAERDVRRALSRCSELARRRHPKE